MKITDLHNYDDIINMPHHISKKHRPMSSCDRAAQFGSFEAVTGHSDAISETERLTSDKRDISDYVMEALDLKLRAINDNIEKLPLVTIKYFLPDGQKSGGEYVLYTGNVRRIDEFGKKLMFTDDKEIKIYDILDIQGDIFK